ncbi:polysaccharide deacetylase [Desulfurivibrio alkaliphilus AHT 2]|uniref:Polysaccharide deacetylase n=1 Tax=Desulfurivibrio alkaliphilus (strain DSM 19089 / UNIQEM U267 / AHT2) TaxID=589865 RepID=D6Z4I3_DESAT|nr:polysaccharide deacetylase [Desulfurivibrio alkaliphilus AHT 2]
MNLLSSAKQRLRRTIGPYIQAMGYATGLMNLDARLRGVNGAIVLMYHSVADHTLSRWIDPRNHVSADIFAQQVSFLARHKRVIALDELVVAIGRGQAVQEGTVVITFDDGYLDNLTVAAPILHRYQMPATLFLPSSYIDRGETQWVDQAYTAFQRRSERWLRWETGVEARWDLGDPEQRRAAYWCVCRYLLQAGAERRRMLLNLLYERLQPTAKPPRLTLTWDEVRRLLSDYPRFSLGGHTTEHLDLTAVPGGEAKKELTQCAQRIKEETGVQPRHFSFCYGRTSEPLRCLLVEAGVEAAFGACGHEPVVNAASDPLNLPRVEAPAAMDHFALATSIANRGLWRRLGR